MPKEWIKQMITLILSDDAAFVQIPLMSIPLQLSCVMNDVVYLLKLDITLTNHIFTYILHEVLSSFFITLLCCTFGIYSKL
jgi:hypothetical protein